MAIMDVPLSAKDHTLKGVSVWGQVILTILALSSVVSYGWISVMDVQTGADVEAVKVELEAEIKGLDSNLTRIEEEVRATNMTVQCILWEVPPEQCAAPRRVP